MLTCGFKELIQLIESNSRIQIVDVREFDEWINGHFKNAIHLPIGLLSTSLHLLSKNNHIALYCKSGYRSGIAAKYLENEGFEVTSIEDNIHEVPKDFLVYPNK